MMCTLFEVCHVVQISAAFSAGSAVAVLAGGLLFCRFTGAGRRNFITSLTILASVCFFVLTRYAASPYGAPLLLACFAALPTI